MNPLERLLQDDLNHLVDRLAVTTPEGLVSGCAERRQDLLSQVAESEARLSAARQDLLDRYRTWRDALAECEDLWALLELAAASAAPGDRRAA